MSALRYPHREMLLNLPYDYKVQRLNADLLNLVQCKVLAAQKMALTVKAYGLPDLIGAPSCVSGPHDAIHVFKCYFYAIRLQESDVKVINTTNKCTALYNIVSLC